jgi:hypothetical protein
VARTWCPQRDQPEVGNGHQQWGLGDNIRIIENRDGGPSGTC